MIRHFKSSKEFGIIKTTHGDLVVISYSEYNDRKFYKIENNERYGIISINFTSEAEEWMKQNNIQYPFNKEIETWFTLVFG